MSTNGATMRTTRSGIATERMKDVSGTSMANTALSSAQVGEFCESMSLMLSAGVTLAEGSALLAEGYSEQAPERGTFLALYRSLAEGSSLADAIEATGALPLHVARMVRDGERTGRLEATLRSLARYYDERARLFARVRTAVAYPCALLCAMSAILAFCVIGILPVFSSVYDRVAGGLSAASAAFVDAGTAIGWTALVVAVVLASATLFVYGGCRSETGRERLLALGERMPGLRGPLYSIALSRFVSTLSVYLASGSHADEAMAAAAASVEHSALAESAQAAYEAMVQPVRPSGLVQALVQRGMIDEVSGRMLEFGSRSGSLDAELADLSEELFENGIERFDRAVDMVEPILVALLTIAIGATLVAVMLPLVGILGALG